MYSLPKVILQVDLEGGIQSNRIEETEGVQEILGSSLSGKSRGAYLMRSEELKVEIIEGVGSYIPNGDDFRVPVDIWEGETWEDKGVKVGGGVSVFS